MMKMHNRNGSIRLLAATSEWYDLRILPNFACEVLYFYTATYSYEWVIWFENSYEFGLWSIVFLKTYSYFNSECRNFKKFNNRERPHSKNTKSSKYITHSNQNKCRQYQNILWANTKLNVGCEITNVFSSEHI